MHAPEQLLADVEITPAVWKRRVVLRIAGQFFLKELLRLSPGMGESSLACRTVPQHGWFQSHRPESSPLHGSHAQAPAAGPACFFPRACCTVGRHAVVFGHTLGWRLPSPRGMFWEIEHCTECVHLKFFAGIACQCCFPL